VGKTKNDHRSGGRYRLPTRPKGLPFRDNVPRRPFYGLSFGVYHDTVVIGVLEKEFELVEV